MGTALLKFLVEGSMLSRQVAKTMSEWRRRQRAMRFGN